MTRLCHLVCKLLRLAASPMHTYKQTITSDESPWQDRIIVQRYDSRPSPNLTSQLAVLVANVGTSCVAGCSCPPPKRCYFKLNLTPSPLLQMRP